jgi:hypothetical protein
MTKNWKKYTAERTSKLQKKPSALQREHLALHNMKILNFFSLFLWVIFALLDLDPDSESRSGSNSESGSGFTDLIESGSNPGRRK